MQSNNILFFNGTHRTFLLMFFHHKLHFRSLKNRLQKSVSWCPPWPLSFFLSPPALPRRLSGSCRRLAHREGLRSGEPCTASCFGSRTCRGTASAGPQMCRKRSTSAFFEAKEISFKFKRDFCYKQIYFIIHKMSFVQGAANTIIAVYNSQSFRTLNFFFLKTLVTQEILTSRKNITILL